jgi:hypothetical protein
MPTLVRFLVVLIVLAAIGIAGMFYLANFVEPRTREMTVKVPADRLQPKEVPPPPAVAVVPAADSAGAPADATPADATAAPAAPADVKPAAPVQPQSRSRRNRIRH